MASTSAAAMGAPCILTVCRSYDRRRRRCDFGRLCLSSNSGSSFGIGSLRTAFRREDCSGYPTKPRRLAGQPWRTEGAVARSQAGSSDNRVATKEEAGVTDKLHEFIIVGAGIAGLATAAAMHKIGVKSLVVEQSATLRATGSALSLWRNAWHVLDVLGVADQLRPKYLPITGARFYNQRGDLLKAFETAEYPGGPHELRGVERKWLVETLASVLPEGTIRFNAQVVSIKRESEVSPVELTLSDGSVIKTKVLLGADGVNSVVGKWMGLPQTRYVGYMGIRGLAVYPDGHDYGDWMRQYCGAGARAGVVPISTSKVYWFVTYNKANPGPKVTDPHEVKKELSVFIEDWPELMKDLLEHTPVESLSRAAISDRWSLPGSTSVVQSGVTLAGDALHPMTPNLGQGGCCALEDAIILARTLGPVLSRGGDADFESITKALEEYAAERQRRTLPLTIRSFVIGYLLQISFPLVVYVRDKLALPRMVSLGSFLNNTLYNPGQLPVTQPVKAIQNEKFSSFNAICKKLR